MESRSVEVKLGERTVKLRAPASYALRVEITSAAATNAQRAFCAALAACWSEESLGRPTVRYAACGYNPLDFGGRVLDELAGRGIPTREILAAGARAWDLLSDGVLTHDEVTEAEGNSGAPSGG